MTTPKKYDILNPTIERTDFLCQNDPLSCAKERTVFSIVRRIEGFLLGVAMQRGKSFKKGQTPWNKGKKDIYSSETLQKLRNARLGKHHSKETKEKISKSGIGIKKPHSEEHKRNLRLNHADVKWEKHPYWKGDNAKYSALHRRVEIKRGKPKFCEICKTSDKSKKYHWANLTGNFTDVMDYKRLCLRCHRKYDTKKGAKPWKKQ